MAVSVLVWGQASSNDVPTIYTDQRKKDPRITPQVNMQIEVVFWRFQIYLRPVVLSDLTDGVLWKIVDSMFMISQRETSTLYPYTRVKRSEMKFQNSQIPNSSVTNPRDIYLEINHNKPSINP